MAYTFDSDLFSDLHKDAYGFRPSQSYWEWFKSATDDEKQAAWDSMVEDVKVSVDREQQLQAEAITRTEKRIFEIMAAGAKTRQRAIKWLLDSFKSDPIGYCDQEYVEYELGLPYGWFKQNL